MLQDREHYRDLFVHALLQSAQSLRSEGTLTGVGGCGKTRLSIELAGQMTDQFAYGVWWVGLVSVQDEELVAQTAKKTLGIPDSQKTSAEESILKFLRPRRALLVLDNCEHVILACAQLIEVILLGCPGIKVLATSREALSIHSEIAWLVPSLSVVRGLEQPADEKELILGIRLASALGPFWNLIAEYILRVQSFLKMTAATIQGRERPHQKSIDEGKGNDAR